MDIKDKILKLLKVEKLATISTVGLNLKPESALVAFAEDSLLNIYFQTSENTRKFANLLENNNVAFVVGFGRITIQYEGIATKIANERRIERVKEIFIKKNSPTTKTFLDREKVSFFIVEPTWIGYSDYTKAKPFVDELKF